MNQSLRLFGAGRTLGHKVLLPLLLLNLASCGSSHGGSSSKTQERSAAPKSQCAYLTTESGKSLEYCALLSKTNVPAAGLVYFFHGLGGSAEDLLSADWQKLALGLSLELGDHMPSIVSISYGPAAVIVPESSGDLSPKPDEFIKTVMPTIEKALGFGKDPKRMLLGASMGGFNALNVASASPDDFRAMALLCPAIIDFNPFVTSEVSSYLERNRAVIQSSQFTNALNLALAVFGNSKNWSDADPMRSLRDGAYDHLRVYLSTGASDDYGFFEGASRFAQISNERKIQLEWYPVQGGHCSFNSLALIRYFKSFGGL